MRTDEEGNPCPATLGEYRALCRALGGADCRAVEFLDRKIQDQGHDQPVLADDSQMRMLLMPMLIQKAGGQP